MDKLLCISKAWKTLLDGGYEIAQLTYPHSCGWNNLPGFLWGGTVPIFRINTIISVRLFHLGIAYVIICTLGFSLITHQRSCLAHVDQTTALLRTQAVSESSSKMLYFVYFRSTYVPWSTVLSMLQLIESIFLSLAPFLVQIHLFVLSFIFLMFSHFVSQTVKSN